MTAQPPVDHDLVAYYDAEAGARAARELPQPRQTHRSAFIELLRGEGRTSVLEVGAGPGRDGDAFAASGLDYRGVDLSPGQVAQARSRGLEVSVAPARNLPFDDDAFDAAWTMSTLMHLRSDDLPQALTEIIRVLKPGSPLAIGVWGASENQQRIWDDGRGFGPPRFFNLQTDETLRAILQSHGTLEDWVTWPGTGDLDLHYQWAILRTFG